MIQKQQTEARQRKDRVVLTFKSCQSFFHVGDRKKKGKRKKEGKRRREKRFQESERKDGEIEVHSC